jgi:hypothetical protein
MPLALGFGCQCQRASGLSSGYIGFGRISLTPILDRRSKIGQSPQLHMMYYNFARIHKTLRVTPAMAAGVTDKLWEISNVVAMLEKWDKQSITVS